MTIVAFSAVQQKAETDEPKTDAERALALLELLNNRAGRNYRPVEANMRLIRARLREYDYDDLRSMVVMKCREWEYRDKMRPYLRPATLFNAEKCAQYTGELES